MLVRNSLLFAATLVAFVPMSVEARDDWRDDRRYEYQNRGTPYRGMDSNRDGVVTRREWRGSNDEFRREDRNRDGVLSSYELNSRSNGYYGRDDARRDDGWRDDRYRNDVITRGEWRGSRQEFERLDRNRNGVLTRDEMRDWRY